jgi:uncharacterized membrane protein
LKIKIFKSNKYLVIINFRTIIALVITLIVLWLSYIFNFSYNIDLTLLSIAIIFPLVFNIRGSFKRRERALEYLSRFRSALLTLNYYFRNSPKLTEDDKNEITNILLEIGNEITVHLGKSDYDTKAIDERVQKVFNFLQDKDELIPSTE